MILMNQLFLIHVHFDVSFNHLFLEDSKNNVRIIYVADFNIEMSSNTLHFINIRAFKIFI